MKKTALIILLLIPAGLIWGQTGYNARSMGMAGAYHGMATGAEAGLWNPANLAKPGNPHISIDLLNVGLSLGNNIYDLSLYNQYFSKSYFDTHDKWDQTAKDAISGEAEDGLKLFDRIHVTALAVSYDKYAISVNSFSYADAKIPNEMIEIPLQGLGQDPVKFTDIEGEAIMGTEIAFSAAHSFNLNTEWLDSIQVGATVKYLIGHAYGVLDQAEGVVLSNTDSIAVEGTYTAFLVNPSDDEGETGYGFGLDLGTSAQVNEKLTLGLSLHNLIGSIGFGSCEEYQGSYSFHEPGIDQDEFDNLEAYFDSSETEHFASDRKLTYRLPVSFLLSGTYQVSPKIVAEVDYHQGLNNVAGGSTTPRLVAGTELRYLNWLPTRFGVGLGGVQGFTLAFGFGFDLGTYKLDIGMAGQRGLFNHANGINLAMSQRLIF